MIELRKKGFTLIELIAVLVILAIIVVIATPIVLNIIGKVKIHSARRSVDNYGKVVEDAVATYLLEHGKYPASLDEVTVEYSGSKVECEKKTIFDNGAIYLTKCKVDNKYVLDTNGELGYYVYGKKYGVYKIGDTVTYKGIDFYVLEDSDENSNQVKLLKATPMEYNLMAKYVLGIVYDLAKVGNKNGYGYMPYYSRAEGCNGTDNSACDSTYATSDVRKVVDLWASEFFDYNDLVDDDSDGIFARLITKDEYSSINISTITWRIACNAWCGYWTMTSASATNPWGIHRSGGFDSNFASSTSLDLLSTLRPVIVLKKNAIK